MLKKDITTVAGVGLLALLACSSLAAAEADSFNKEIEDLKAVQIARFKAHPEQLKDPNRCKEFIVEYDEKKNNRKQSDDSYVKAVACQAVVEDIEQRKHNKIRADLSAERARLEGPDWDKKKHSWMTDSWTDVGNRLFDGEQAQIKDRAKMDAAIAVQNARFKAHPELLKNNGRCDNILTEPDKNIPDIFYNTKFWDSWRLLAACQDVSGTVGSNDGAMMRALRAISLARIPIETDAIAQKWQRSMDDDNKREQARIDREYEENIARIDREALQDFQRDQKNQTPRRATRALTF